ncbi:MAG: molybdopterin molybdotransferase MoeA [bacterium]
MFETSGENRGLSEMVAVEEALKIILENISTLPQEEVPLIDSLGGVLTEDVFADMDMPPFDKSAVDGYAVAAKDLEALPAVLRVVEEIPAGCFPTRRISPGTCSLIMTGAPIPEGADAVVMVEDTELLGEEVRINRRVKSGDNICLRGEDISAGALTIPAGTPIRPQVVGVLASLGKTRVRIFRKPTLSIITTGDEIVEPHLKPQGGQIRNSNGYSLSAQARLMGLEAHYLGVVSDSAPALRNKIREGLADDVLLISGGVSMGKYDLVERVLEELGVEIFFTKVAIKPGKPTVFGKLGSRAVFGLPGNPVSTFVIFEEFVRPAIRRMMGYRGDYTRLRFPAVLEEDFGKPSERAHYSPARIFYRGGAWRVQPIPSHGSADLASTLEANGVLILPPHSGRRKRGDTVDVQLFEELHSFAL